ncbi:HNH endonuclease [Mycobacterium phage Thibault]|uniref:HNH endonuclease n=1 Tax=Mycobacterium phage Thibault TaxID=1052673 RepID=G1FGJ7_9CAUD|nr:HNH endonuclease [Mycobacterium phage Thibault]AEJ94054.1 HNH endonuclease [Mycobacterium phage Thibault]
MEFDAELWRDIPGYEGLYQASDQGRIRSVDRVIKQVSLHGGFIDRRMPGRVLTPWPHSADGRPWVSLSRDGKVKKLGVHVLVTRTFWGSAPPDKPMALHRNGDPFDNRPGNLYWGDNADNMNDAVRHGTHVAARRTRCPYGHALVDPNIKWTRDRRGRECKACRNANEWARTRRRRGLSPVESEKRAYADKRYAKIMAEE